MESGLVKEGGAVIPRRSRSVDNRRRSVTEVGLNDGGGKGKEVAVGSDDGKRIKKRKSGGEVDLNGEELKVKRSRKSFADGVKLGGSSLDVSQNSNRSGGFSGFSLGVDESGNPIHIPRKPRGSVGSKSHFTKPTGSSSSVDQIARLKSDVKHSEAVAPSLTKRAKKRGEQLVIHNENVDGTSSRKRKSSGKKRKGLQSDSLDVSKNILPAADDTGNNSGDSQDEKNLLENAAMMLSSRFDPRCTGHPSVSRSPSIHSIEHTDKRIENLQAGSVSPSADNARRTQRAKSINKEKQCSRKRRHFYEVVYRDKDARLFLNKRIKVFWPVDERWYHGIVNDYDEERKKHRVKYDDQEEEWINLQNEQFMLLLLRTELTDVEKPVSSGTAKRTGKELVTSEADTYFRSYKDSEPIISLLPRSSHQSESSCLKKQKTVHPSPSFVSVPSRKFTNAHGNGNVSCLEKETSEVCIPDSVDRLADNANAGVEQSTSSKEYGPPIVYFRRRFRKKNDGSFRMPVDNNGQGILPGCLMSVTDTSQTLNKNCVSFDCLDPDSQMWSIGSDGMLKVNLSLISGVELLSQFSLPVCLLNLSFGTVSFRCFHLSLLPRYASIVATWPNVYLEMLFVDNEVGLRFFLLEGCLKQAVAFLLLVLSVFGKPNKLKESVDLQMPATAIRFKLSCIQDHRKQYIYSFYNFYKLENSNWLYLDTVIQKHCVFTKKLSLHECTLENIKALERRSEHPYVNSVSWESSFQCAGTQSFRDIVPVGLSKAGNMNRRQSPNCDATHGMPPFSLSFSAAPSLFQSLHLKLLMEGSVACVRLRDCDPDSSLECQENTCNLTTTNCAIDEDCTEILPQIVPKITSGTLSDERCVGGFSCAKTQLRTHPLTATIDCGTIISSQHHKNQNFDVDRSYTCSKDAGNAETDVMGQSQNWEFNDSEPDRLFQLTKRLTSKDQASPFMSGDREYNSLSSISVDIPAIELAKNNADGKLPVVSRVSDFASNIADGVVLSPNTNAPKSFWTSNMGNSSVSPRPDISPVCHGRRRKVVHSGFGSGPRKQRTQVHYTLPFGGSAFRSKHKPLNQNGNSFRRIKRATNKRISDGSTAAKRDLELSCEANLLITLGDRGWRETGAQVTLELADNNEWILAVKCSGTTMYSHKVRQSFLPSSTNRYTHAMMWKGKEMMWKGKEVKEWALEFPNRSQWVLFKEMHEECCNRNIQAASVKNIPIPGVRRVEDSENNSTLIPFTRSTSRYFRQIETDAEMAMNPSKILYDMDSEDEQWIRSHAKSIESQESRVLIADDLFEKIMDRFEKLAYAQQRDQFMEDEITKVMAGVAPVEMTKAIYQYWWRKRKRNGIPLIRHLQPPSWERYQQKLREWNQLIAKGNTIAVCGGNAAAPAPAPAPAVEKPSMFAFCLKPRGLEVSHKGSKHRSQKKCYISGNSNGVIGDQDGVHASGRSGRRFNSLPCRDEKSIDNSPDNSDTSLHFDTSTRIYSPIDAAGPEYSLLDNDASDLDNHSNLYKSKSKKIRALIPTINSFNQRTLGRKNRVQRQNMELADCPNQKHEGYTGRGSMQLGARDLNLFRARDAVGAAKHTGRRARFKRGRAEKYFARADALFMKAASALMTADAVKTSYFQDDQ